MKNYTAIYSTKAIQGINYSFQAENDQAAVDYCKNKFSVEMESITCDDEALNTNPSTALEIAAKDKSNIVTLKDGTLKSRVKEAISVCVHDTKIHFEHWIGMDRRSRIVTFETEISTLLLLGGFEKVRRNDGGSSKRCGDYFEVSKEASEFLTSLVK